MWYIAIVIFNSVITSIYYTNDNSIIGKPTTNLGHDAA